MKIASKSTSQSERATCSGKALEKPFFPFHIYIYKHTHTWTDIFAKNVFQWQTNKEVKKEASFSLTAATYEYRGAKEL